MGEAVHAASHFKVDPAIMDKIFECVFIDEFFLYKINELFQLDSTRLNEQAPGSEEEGEDVWCQECRVR